MRARLAALLGPEAELAPYLRGFRFAGDGVTTGFVLDGDPTPEGVGLRLENTGLGQIAPVVESLSGDSLDISDIVAAQNPIAQGNFGGITVSTLAEARYFAAAGYRDILYGVGIVPDKLEAVAALVDSELMSVDIP